MKTATKELALKTQITVWSDRITNQVAIILASHKHELRFNVNSRSSGCERSTNRSDFQPAQMQPPSIRAGMNYRTIFLGRELRK
ncbi:MAG TPA: hypothetical protein DDZ51_18300 [Planctomycetaceae bacterium]|nr:hypothetical protein [Planctomycetaceae bacterium]